MSKTANKTLIGAFVAGGIALLLLALAVFGSGKFFKKSYTFVLFFDRSISGLSVGSPVVFRGVPVGRVIRIRLEGDMRAYTFRTAVYIELNEDSNDDMELPKDDVMNTLNPAEVFQGLIMHGLRASLASQSLITGQLMIELNMVSTTVDSQSVLKTYGGVAEIPVVPSQLDSFVNTISAIPLDEIGEELSKLVAQLNQMAAEASQTNLVGNAGALLTNLNKFVVDAHVSIKAVEVLANNVDGLVGEARGEVNITLQSIRQSLDEASLVMKSFNVAALEAGALLSNSQKIFNPHSSTLVEFNRVLREVTEAARSVRALANTLERSPESLLRGKR